MIKKLADEHETVLVHGNGPQVGELALERSAATFDVLGAESQGQIGYIFSQAMASVGKPAACLGKHSCKDTKHALVEVI